MRLNQIKIAGFKSFVDPSKIVFPANVTGIVGPNGCGKSNVIDAVRWVMGESSARNLRGESMEDVIFSGSSSRQPVGQASVELVFDNSDGRVKGEYAKYNEISVKRLSTRVGKSKYFLNNTRCRRRDIADIFLGTGLGPRSYSIIEQGMVSRVIDAKPDELRVYLEEAAGISKYKERRRETETRIRHTRENLDRLIDLIDEIDKQLSRLDRQAKAAAKYKRLKQDQRRLEAESLLLQKQVFDAEIETQRRELAGAETDMEKRTADLRETEREIEQGRQKLAEASEQLNRVQGQFYKLGAEISSKEQAIEHQKNLRQRGRQELDSLEQSLKDAGKVLADDAARLEQLELKLADITPELESSNQNLEQQQAAATQAEEKMHEWQELWDQFRREFHQVHESAQIENRGIEHIERQVQRTDQQRLRLQSELDTLDASEAVQEIDQLESGVEASAQEYAATTSQAQARAEDIQALRGSCEESANQLDELRNRVQTMRGRLSSLEALQQHALSETSAEVKQWLEQNQIDSTHRLTSLLKLKGDIGRAVEVVLSPFLGAYCTSTGEPVPDASVPNHSVAVFDRDPVPARSGDRDWPKLSDYIECDVDLSAILDGIYLCRDQQDLRDKRSQLKAGESLVTAQGLWAGGNWILQQGEEDQHAGTLARAQEIDSIRAQLEQITQAATTLKSHYDGDRQRLQVLEQEWDGDQKSLATVQQHLSELRQRLSNRKSEAEQVQSRRQQLHTELAELEEQKLGHTNELQSNSAKRNEFLEQIAQMTELEEGLQAQKTSRQQQLTATRNALQQALESAHQQQIRQQALEAEQRATRSNIERIEQQKNQFDQRVGELEDLMNSDVDPIAEQETALQELLKLRNQNEQELGRAQQAVSELDNRQRELETERNTRQQHVDDFRNQLEQERLQLQEASIRCNTIEEQLQKTGQDVAALQQDLEPEADLDEWSLRLEKLNKRIDRLGPINLAAIEEQKEQAERKQYLDAQHQDLISALETLEDAIRKIDRETRDRFKTTFEQVNSRLVERFPKLFGGGEAHLEMTENDLLNTGVQIMARPPGKRITNLQLLSGGEKALTAVALIFAIFELNPSPFCMLDEVDAPLDDANVGRFCTMVMEMSEQVQFIIITHNKITMEMTQGLNGVTMHEPGVSRLVSVDVGEAVVLAGVQ
ncbi:MAG: chromosome segregation protein SMC [Gammaproteobacteria bacterium]|nr:chromosome segregation protein SMC [Gammaproteobacteria bacterium]MDH3856643.1 chromosome segregation protein SMC [Gammaproteobacteria bacterium]